MNRISTTYEEAKKVAYQEVLEKVYKSIMIQK